MANYAERVRLGLRTIPYCCGVHSTNALNRRHLRIVGANGISHAFADMYPDKEPGSKIKQ